MTDDPVTECTECAAPVERVYHPVAVHFKGSGFYTTDYGRGKGGDSRKATADGAGESKTESDRSSKSSSDSGTKSGGEKTAKAAGDVK